MTDIERYDGNKNEFAKQKQMKIYFFLFRKTWKVMIKIEQGVNKR